MVLDLEQNPCVRAAADAVATEFPGEIVEVAPDHASTASTARANVFHSSRRTASASCPEGVIR